MGSLMAARALMELSQVRSPDEWLAAEGLLSLAEEARVDGSVDVVGYHGPRQGLSAETSRAVETQVSSGGSDNASSSTFQRKSTSAVKRSASNEDEAPPSQPAKRIRRQAPARKPVAGKKQNQEHEAAIPPLTQPKKAAKPKKPAQPKKPAEPKGKGTKRKLERSDLDQSGQQQEAAAPPATKKAKTDALLYPTPPLTRRESLAAPLLDNAAAGPADAPASHDQEANEPTPPPESSEIVSDDTFHSWRAFIEKPQPEEPEPHNEPVAEQEKEAEEDSLLSDNPVDPEKFANLWADQSRVDIPDPKKDDNQQWENYLRIKAKGEAKKKLAREKAKKAEKRAEEEEAINNGTFRRERKKSKRQMEMEEDAGAKRK